MCARANDNDAMRKGEKQNEESERTNVVETDSSNLGDRMFYLRGRLEEGTKRGISAARDDLTSSELKRGRKGDWERKEPRLTTILEVALSRNPR